MLSVFIHNNYIYGRGQYFFVLGVYRSIFFVLDIGSKLFKYGFYYFVFYELLI